MNQVMYSNSLQHKSCILHEGAKHRELHSAYHKIKAYTRAGNKAHKPRPKPKLHCEFTEKMLLLTLSQKAFTTEVADGEILALPFLVESQHQQCPGTGANISPLTFTSFFLLVSPLYFQICLYGSAHSSRCYLQRKSTNSSSHSYTFTQDQSRTDQADVSCSSNGLY